MQASAAFVDYRERFRGAAVLLRVALAANEPLLATSASKGAIVLAAAAAERFMNDGLRSACQRAQLDRYELLSEGQQAYLCTQIARKIALFDRGDGDIRQFNVDRRARLVDAISECKAAFENPSGWTHVPEFGMFMDGAAAPDKVNAVLRDFDPERGSFFNELDHKPAGRGAYIRALIDLVDARHNAAHAKSATDPSPTDARSWIVSSFWLIKTVETYLLRLSPLIGVRHLGASFTCQ